MNKYAVTEFYCKRYCDGYPELHYQNEPNEPCKEQCIECACDVGERRIKTKEQEEQ